ncbi:deuterosome assembly protein 1 isoform X3 [Dendrobates tinctorius]|uniref:deuterosome assembly protein 1 isoform X3 n=1 Tax=Dendrobates tinctorius TaxID=92724 RepID=UPI003CCA373D
MDVTKQRAAFQKYQTLGDSSCENELEELMHQIDIMVNSKKGEWEKQVLVLEQRLQAQELELTRTGCALDQKDCEIGVLSKKLEEAEKSRHEVVQNYETQLEALKNQLSKLKKSYDKLHYYHVKNHKNDSAEASMEPERSQADLHRLSQRLEKQSHCHPEQRSCRTRLQDEAITNNQSDIRRLRCQLDVSQETIRSGRVIIENLKNAVKEITLSRNSLKAENLQLLQELRDCQKHCQRTESKLSEAATELRARQDLCRATEMDQRQLHTLISEKDEENKLSSQESYVFMKKQVSNREKLQKRLKLSPCKKDQVEEDFFIKEIRDMGLERLQADVSDLTERLHRKDVTIATISRKVSRLERELDMKEHGNVHRQVSISSDGRSRLHELTLEPEMETHLGSCSDGQELEEGLQLEMMKTFSWQCGITGKLSQGQHDGSSEEDEETPKVADNDTNNVRSYRSGDGRLTDHECLDFILPKMSPSRNDHYFPEMDLTDFSHFVYDQSGDSTAEQSFVSAAERFLQEENRRARDFENILNSQIEELQRHSEHTVKRCRSRGQSDCPPASS